MDGQVGALRKILSEQAVRVLIGAALPGALRVAEIDLDVGGSPRKRDFTSRFVGVYSLLWRQALGRIILFIWTRGRFVIIEKVTSVVVYR